MESKAIFLFVAHLRKTHLRLIDLGGFAGAEVGEHELIFARDVDIDIALGFQTPNLRRYLED